MKTSTFIVGLAIALVAMIGGGVVIAALSHGTSRPEGVAENWLTAVSDTTRKGVEVDARKRAAKIGDLSFAKDLVYPNADAIKRKSAFDDLEVGKAQRLSLGGRVPFATVGFRVHALRPNDKKVAITGVLSMDEHFGRWKVVGVEIGDAAKAGVPKLPSDGGPLPSKAPRSLWVGALFGAGVLGVITTSFVRLAGRAAPAAATA